MSLRIQCNALLADDEYGRGAGCWVCTGTPVFYESRHGLLGESAAGAPGIQCSGRNLYSGIVCVGVFLAGGAPVGDLSTY
jgi:hypothetical protein